MLRYFFSIALVFLCFAFQAKGQVIETDSIPKGKMWIPTHIRIGTDLVSLGRTGFSDFTEMWEMQAEVDLYKFYLVFDYGHQNYRVNQDSTTRSQYLKYLSSGYYWRLGLDANVISYDRYGGDFSLGIRFGSTRFEERMGGTKNVDGWGLYDFYYTNPNASANWLELTTGIKAKVWKGLTMGYTLRLKFAANLKGDDEIETYWIPGYGLASRNSNWAISYYVYWTFGWKEKYLPRRNR